jgi:pimeloyl-ACP methyl ester carboxylesterase
MRTLMPSVFKSAKGKEELLSAYDAAMKLWPVPYQTRDVPTGFGSTHVIFSGPEDKPPLVLLHCALMTSAIWSPIIGELSCNFRTYAVDVIGDIGRTVPERPPDNLGELAQWLVEVYRELGIERARLLGWSFGGFVATNFAVHEPEHVEKLALLAPFATFVRPGMGFLKGFLPFLIPTRGTARRFEQAMCFKGDFGHAEHAELLYQRFKNGRLAFRVAPRTFTDGELARLTMPTLLLVGDHELLYDPKAAVERAKRVLPSGDVELVRDCNHAMVSDQTARVSARLTDFLRSGSTIY